MGSIRNKNNWNNVSKRLFGSYSHSGIPGFHSGYSAPRSRIAGIYSGIHSYSGIFPNAPLISLCYFSKFCENSEIQDGGSKVAGQMRLFDVIANKNGIIILSSHGVRDLISVNLVQTKTQRRAPIHLHCTTVG